MALTEAQKRNAEKNRQYWVDREAEALKHYIKEEAEYDKQIQKIYKNMLDDIQTQINSFYGKYAAKEGITLAEAKKRVSKLDIEAYERKAKRYVKDKDFSAKANEEMRLYNATMKINRLEMLKANIGLETIAGHNELEKFMEKILRGRTEAELARQAGILGKTIHGNSKLAHAIPNASFHSGTFSDRIWQYQDLMRGDLEKLLTRGLIQGKNARALTADLRKYLIGDKNGKGATYNVERLMRTELARVQTEAQKQSFVRNGFEKYIFIVNGGCCDICEAAKNKDIGHGKGIYLVKDMMPGENASPMHPHCRCSTAAYSDRKEYDEWLDFLANGGTTEEWEKLKAETPKPTAARKPLDISSMTAEEFEQWKKAYYDDVNGNVHLTAAELKALDDYGEGGYELLNAYGRYGADSDKFKAVLKKYGNKYTAPEIEERFNAVQSALNKFSLNESITVHRAVRDISFMTDDISVEGLKKLKGKTITEGGFISTSLAYQRKFEGRDPNAVHIEYVLPKGSKGAYIDKFVAKDEHEFLLSAGTKYKIVDGGERVVKVPKYDFKLREWVEIEKTERFLKAEVIPGVLTKTVKSGTMPSNKYGFKYIKGEHTREADLAATNPKYSTGKEYKVNCQRCVSAYEARRRGYDVEAKPAILNGVDRMPYMFDKKEGWTSVYDGIKPINCASNRTAGVKKKVEETMSSFGDGARAIVRVQWQKKYGGGGHVFIAEQVDGSTIFIDPQPNKTDVGYYFSMAKTKETYVLRIDNLEFTDNIHKCCENKK